MKKNLGHNSDINTNFPYAIYSEKEIKLEEGRVKGKLASGKDIIIKEGFILDDAENGSIFLLDGNSINGTGLEMYRDKLVVLEKLPIYELPIFPVIAEISNKSYEQEIITIYEDIELKTNVNLEVETKIDNKDKEIEILLKMNKKINEDIYIHIVHINSNFEEVEIKLENNLNITGDIYININSNAKEIEFELGRSTLIIGNIFVVNINNSEFNDTEFELELDEFTRIDGNIHIESNTKEIEVELDNNAKVIGNIYSNSTRKSGETEFEVELDSNANISGNIYSNAKEVEIKGDNNIGTIKGLIYAPHAEVEIEDGIKIYGAVVGSNVKVEDKCTEIIYSPEFIIEDSSTIKLSE